jgi:CopG family transcriptional regulator/antitoxin EndoAI
MRSTQTFTVSVPPAMAAEIDRVRRKENRTRSELVREALRTYIADRYPTAQPSGADLARIRKGRAEIRRGDFVTLDQLRDVLDAPRRQPRRKVAAARSR